MADISGTGAGAGKTSGTGQGKGTASVLPYHANRGGLNTDISRHRARTRDAK